MPKSTPHWDVFCAVVDNYGDAGIAWRLARMLAGEHGVRVRLYIDVLATLARLAPAIDPARAVQDIDGIELRAWRGPQAPFSGAEPGEVVIEAFGCGLPELYLDAMAARASPPVWINLEYLSAEKWIEDCHGLASRHPTRPLTRYFFFPGFSPASGGLLRERDLLTRRDRFLADDAARAALWRKFGVSPSAPSFVVSLFCYGDAPVAPLFEAWADGEAPILCLVPEGVAAATIERCWTEAKKMGPHELLMRGRLALARIPFVSQDDYDRLLWACDVNFVRGEDSFVRAQWAARPLIWNVYPQAEAAHRLKLEAFLQRYTATLPPDAASAFAWAERAWNGHGDIGPAWKAMFDARAVLAGHAGGWAARLAGQSDLVTALVKFCRDRL